MNTTYFFLTLRWFAVPLVPPHVLPPSSIRCVLSHRHRRCFGTWFPIPPVPPLEYTRLILGHIRTPVLLSPALLLNDNLISMADAAKAAAIQAALHELEVAIDHVNFSRSVGRVRNETDRGLTVEQVHGCSGICSADIRSYLNIPRRGRSRVSGIVVCLFITRHLQVELIWKADKRNTVTWLFFLVSPVALGKAVLAK